ncbi:MAG: carbohydrate ABC transporter permease [Provencibacterium sp.]|jgi:putative aldouronate transport system permease protein|nr:carbohydrate ABC transporter permease [Provencibacterium sp.]
MAIQRTRGERIFDAVNTIVLFILSAITLYPLLYVLFASVSEPGPLMSHRGLLLAPLGVQWSAYRLVFQNPIILSSYANTLLYVTAGTALSLVLTTLGAYGLSRKNVKWSTPLMMLIVFTMWFSGGMIPHFLNVSNLGMMNSRLALILPKAVATYNLIVMRTSFQALPDSLEESAKIDGANDFTILLRIAIPLSMPVIAVIILFYASSQWNAWFDAMLFLNRRELFPLQLILREILVLNSTDSMMAGSAAQSDQIQIGETIKYATVIVATVPILCIYPFLQKYFVKGVMVGAIKG